MTELVFKEGDESYAPEAYWRLRLKENENKT